MRFIISKIFWALYLVKRYRLPWNKSDEEANNQSHDDRDGDANKSHKHGSEVLDNVRVLPIVAAIYDKYRVQGLVKPVLQELSPHVQDIINDVEKQVDVVWDYNGKL